MSATSDFYTARADECAAEARKAVLDNVRDRCLRSEQAWRQMATRLLRAEDMRAALLKAKEQPDVEP